MLVSYTAPCWSRHLKGSSIGLIGKTCKKPLHQSLKFHTLCGLHQIKKCWKFELDILIRFGIIATQKCIDYIMKCWECTLRREGGEGWGVGGCGRQWAIFSYFSLLGYCSKRCIKLSFLIQGLCYLADLCHDSISIKLCFQIYNILFVYANIDIFLSNDHIWNYRKLNSHISQTHIDISFTFSGFSILIDFFTESQNCKDYKICIFQCT